MKKSEITQLLAYVSKGDGRQIDALDSEFWHRSIGDVEYEAALDAVLAFYATEDTRYIRPAHVIKGVSAAAALARRARQRSEREQLYAAQREALMAVPESERSSLEGKHADEGWELAARHSAENARERKQPVDWMNPELEPIPISEEWRYR